MKWFFNMNGERMDIFNVDKVVVIYNTWQGLNPSIILLIDMYKLQEI